MIRTHTELDRRHRSFGLPLPYHPVPDANEHSRERPLSAPPACCMSANRRGACSAEIQAPLSGRLRPVAHLTRPTRLDGRDITRADIDRTVDAFLAVHTSRRVPDRGRGRALGSGCVGWCHRRRRRGSDRSGSDDFAARRPKPGFAGKVGVLTVASGGPKPAPCPFAAETPRVRPSGWMTAMYRATPRQVLGFSRLVSRGGPCTPSRRHSPFWSCRASGRRSPTTRGPRHRS